MTGSCPSCGKAVDALRARHTRVEGARVVAFCSAECLAGAPSSGVPVAASSPRHSSLIRAGIPSVGIPRRDDSARRGDSLVAAMPVAVTMPTSRSTRAESAHREPDVAEAPDVTDEAVGGIGPDLTMPVVTVETTHGSNSAATVAPKRGNNLEPLTGSVATRDATAKRTIVSEPNVVVAPGRRTRPGRVTDDVREPKRSWLTVAVVVLVIGAVALFAVKSCGSKSASTDEVGPPVGSTSPVNQKSGTAVIAQVASIDVAAVRATATEILSGYLNADADQIRRLSAAALARTQEPRAIEVLTTLLESEQNPSLRSEIAYALARGGDRGGLEWLRQEVKSDQRDRRSDAARLLLMLGDDAGRAPMARNLELGDRRLAAAEALARLADPEANKLLRTIRADSKSSVEEVRRATIALGRAGDSSVAAELRDLLTDVHSRNDAAEALVRLGDVAARPVLAQQLRLDSLCVQGAIGLRRLEPTLDAAPLLRGLADTLSSSKDVTQINAAEAVLILTGPAALAEHD